MAILQAASRFPLPAAGFPINVQSVFNSVLGNRAEVILADPNVSVTLEKLSPAFKRYIRLSDATIPSGEGNIFRVVVCKGELVITMQVIRSAVMA